MAAARPAPPALLAIVFIGVVLLMGLGYVLGSGFHRPWFLWPLGVIAFITFARFGRPRFFPVGKLVDAAARLSGGDYSVRVPDVESGPMRQVVRSFNGMAERLEQSSDQRRRLLADLGHELRTPLTVIQGELEAMADGVHPIDREQLEMLLDETRLLARLIDDLRVLSLSEAGELRLDTELDRRPHFWRMPSGHTSLRPPGRASPSPPRAEPGSLLADPLRLREVIANVLTNAIRHTSRRRHGDSDRNQVPARLVVLGPGHGQGIPPEQLPMIFERFVKGADSRGRDLGLSIARELVRAHGGEMTAASVEGQGTTIEFSVPSRRAILMLFLKRFWEPIAQGEVTVTFRRWKSQQVIAGPKVPNGGGDHRDRVGLGLRGGQHHRRRRPPGRARRCSQPDRRSAGATRAAAVSDRIPCRRRSGSPCGTGRRLRPQLRGHR